MKRPRVEESLGQSRTFRCVAECAVSAAKAGVAAAWVASDRSRRSLTGTVNDF